MAGTFLKLFKPLIRFMPEVKPPERRVSFREKLIWTGVILVLYIIMANLPLYGVPQGQGYDYLYFLRVILASSRGTLMELGIGPIVTAGLVMQLLAGSKLIDVDFSNPEDRALFTGAQKALAVLMTMMEAGVFIAARAYGDLSTYQAALVFLQLTAAGIALILMDETLQKGWGLGSGISLFIAANVAGQIIWLTLNPNPSPYDYLGVGVLVALVQVITFPYWPMASMFLQVLGSYPSTQRFSEEAISAATQAATYMFYYMAFNPNTALYYVFFRSHGQPNIIGLLGTLIIFLIVILIQSVRVEIPLQYARFRGFRGRYPIKFLYVSVIPVILVQAIIANLLLVSQVLWSNVGFVSLAQLIPFLKEAWPNIDLNLLMQFSSIGWNFNPLVNIIGQFIPSTTNLNQLTPAGGIAYYFSTPYGLENVFRDPGRALIYLLIFSSLCAALSYIWIDVSGMSARDVANQLIMAGMQVPGFRRSPKIVEKILERYIPPVTVLGGFAVGLLAAFADFLGALGTGTGVLLTVGILYNYYELIAKEQLASISPALRGLLGLE